MATLFISDLHLDANLPELTRLFERFMAEQAPQAEALYILGDLFEAWVGDDDDRPETERFISSLRALSDQGVPLYVMHGNRDFLLASGFAARTGCTLISEPSLIDLYGTPTLLLHGDSLCTDDVKHQESRLLLRSQKWQEAFLAHALDKRIQLAQEYRGMSREHLRDKPEAIMDVNAGAVGALMQEYGVRQMIHGHTHRPAIHNFTLGAAPARRIVLGDWGQFGSILSCDKDGCELKRFPG
ncbi:UDP-2,3-diacylglucosamine diphosphatase [Sulfuriflexus mobilis]|uniref:UDP-2,3-diacylglucosamine diphosphatase n=1 Tax=Sulfuriflexus mobilis TaxID=1811807 RepID=UPI000F817E87|nr:UDP-2,3-diacylglucosamine diphosphatase [Sulfuriflexus mobilis]